jgi:hypothetical protein
MDGAGSLSWQVGDLSSKCIRLLTVYQEGLATVVIAFAAYWFVENYPETAKFLSKSEKDFIQARLAADSNATRHEKFTWNAVFDAFRDPNCWLYGLGFHTMSLPLYTLSLFLVWDLRLRPFLMRSLCN